MKNKIYIMLVLLVIISTVACDKNFLDVVPEGAPTLDNAFTMRGEAQKYLATCYSYLPNEGSWNDGNVANLGGDEIWLAKPGNTSNKQIAMGNQNANSPYSNIWGNMYKAIRTCNTFLANIKDTSKVLDLTLDERTQWIGEAEFLKAYYHFLLFRQYGPIPIVDVNMPINTPIEKLKVKRQPVDSVVNYIVRLLDDAAPKLPITVLSPSTQNGHITRPAALAIKARVLTYAASPLYNGNADYANFKDKDGTLLFNPTFSVDKWKRAAEAGKEAIAVCKEAGIHLYTFVNTSGFSLTDTTMYQMSIRNAVCDPWNQELIWASSNSSCWDWAYNGMAHIDPNDPSNSAVYGIMGVPLGIVEQFYTKNGVPIDEDKTLDFNNINQLRVATHEERFDLIENYTTARINFDRENRFYADIGFDGGVWFMQNSPTNSDENTWQLKCRLGQYGAGVGVTVTTYYPKKMINWKFAFNGNNSAHTEDYPFPSFRLADLYLLYAEAQNEAEGPSAEVYQYLDSIRFRAGLKGVVESWQNYSNNPGKPLSKEGLRSIIQRERNIEMTLEGSRFWDLRRWKTAATVLNENIVGWDGYASGGQPELFYRPTTYYTMKFIAPRDYLWPLKTSDLTNNENLVQNPGW